MKTSYKIILSSVIQYLVIGLSLLFFANAMHEMLHLKILTSLGGNGYIVMRGGTSETIITAMPDCADLIATSGIIVGAVFTVIAYIAHRRHFIEMYTSLLPTIFVQFAYGVFELKFWRMEGSEFMLYATVVAVTSTLIGFFISIYILYLYLRTQLDEQRPNLP